ncbi:MAG: hypothetical protein RL660_1767 [Bacteroidota bacterium]|jgi:hypothetical protein
MERTVLKRAIDQNLKQTIEKRNKRLLNFFRQINSAVEIVGDMETPAVVLGNVCLSCYVHNFNLVFTNHYLQGEEVYRVKLQKDQMLDMQAVEQWINNAVHRPVYRIKLNTPDLYLVGFNFNRTDTGEEKFPVFGKHGAKVYFSKDFAQDIVGLYGLDYCSIV